MKHLLLLTPILLFILFAENSYSQIELKPAIGLNFTGFSKDPMQGETSAKVGWQFGGTISAGDKFYGEGGIFWTYKSNEYNSNDNEIKFNTEISGIRIPAMVGYHLLGKETSFVGLRAFSGASVYIVTKVDALELTKDDFNTASWGLFIGAGIDISMVFVDVKYEWSLTNVSSISSFDVGKSRSFIINGGVRISI